MGIAEILSLVSTIAYVLAVVCAALAVFFWFFLKIPAVINYLSGRRAKKSVAKMRQTGNQTGNKSFRSSAVNMERGKLTDVMPDNKPKTTPPEVKQNSLASSLKSQPNSQSATQKPVAPEGSEETALLTGSEETALLEGTEETTLLEGAEETALLSESSETALLEEYETTALNPVPIRRTGGVKLEMLDEVMLIHTDEVI